jgi:hypothetical protein
MTSDVNKNKEPDVVPRDDIPLPDSDILEVDSPASLKRKIKRDCDSRKKLEQKLEESRISRQVQDYDFDHLD